LETKNNQWQLILILFPRNRLHFILLQINRIYELVNLPSSDPHTKYASLPYSKAGLEGRLFSSNPECVAHLKA